MFVLFVLDFFELSLCVSSHVPRTYSCEEIANGYIFFDWFAIPQITARKQGPSDCVVSRRKEGACGCCQSFSRATCLSRALKQCDDHLPDASCPTYLDPSKRPQE